MKWILFYVRQRIGVLLLLLAIGGIFGAVFSLYDLPVEAVGYAAVISGVLCFCVMLVDWMRIGHKYGQLKRLCQNGIQSADQLPPPSGPTEQAYGMLISSILQQHRQIMNRVEQEENELLDYYILWAHQIKTPIAAMRLVLQEEDSARSRELQGQLFRVEEYVQMVLAFLRMRSTSTDYVLRECSLDEIVREAVHKYAPMFIRKHLTLELQPISLRVLTDEKWLCFVLEQLLSNAIKYTQTGGVRIWTEGETLVLSDTGAGIAPEDLPRVWEKGFTGYHGRRDKRATGLGLYLVQEILQKLGHGISVTSQLGHGTTVRLDLHTDHLEVE